MKSEQMKSDDDEFLFRQETITIAAEKPYTVRGLVSDDAPGLSITNDCGLFAVTHVASGLSLVTGYERAANAGLVMFGFQLIAKHYGFSFELSGEEIKKKIAEIGSNAYPSSDLLSVKIWIDIARDNFNEFPWEDRHPYEECRNMIDQIRSVTT